MDDFNASTGICVFSSNDLNLQLCRGLPLSPLAHPSKDLKVPGVSSPPPRSPGLRLECEVLLPCRHLGHSGKVYIQKLSDSIGLRLRLFPKSHSYLSLHQFFQGYFLYKINPFSVSVSGEPTFRKELSVPNICILPMIYIITFFP